MSPKYYIMNKKHLSKQVVAIVYTLEKKFFCSHNSWNLRVVSFRSRPPGMFLGKGVLKICSKFTGGHPFRWVISI